MLKHPLSLCLERMHSDALAEYEHVGLILDRKALRGPTAALGQVWHCHFMMSLDNQRNASGVVKNRLIRLDNNTGKQLNFRVICFRRENASVVCFWAFSLKLDTDFQCSCGSRHPSCV